ncbi:DMT family transporter [Fischerella sp. PCC 9605]|uniref:DMT family transporter n=1 Tax=Fischerella sp. PCC 9605 TaxID=1173024 RepID=UPI00047BA1D0|nr:multidrug efflux SMR transporter [Fischerella sp. PCC 9605]
MAWTLLFAAGILEIAMAASLKYSKGWTRFEPSALGIGAAIASFYLLTLALRDLPIGTAYAVWTGIGTVGVALIGIVMFGESASSIRLALIGLILAGMIGLKLIET